MVGRLRPLDVHRETRPGKYPNRDGLYLIIASATSKSWSYRYWKDGKQRWLGLGSLKDVSLKDARLARDAARLRVKGDRSTPGVDLVEQNRAARAEAKAVEIKVTLPSFEECAETYIREHWLAWSKKHRNQWPSSLTRYAFPTIGKVTIPEIRPSHIYELLRPIWVEKRETAIVSEDASKQSSRRTLMWTTPISGIRRNSPKQLREKLPKRPKRVVRHHPALPYADAPQFMADICAAGGMAALMLRFLIFTACRTNEVVEARWSEIDRASSTWRVPRERMKMNQDHVVPLSDPALAILDRMRDGVQGEKIFPNPNGGVFSENAMLAVLERLGYNHVTVHGFRSTFATWAEDCTDHPDGVREAALAHKYKSETTAAYQRGQKLEKRRELMNDWARFLAGSSVMRFRAVG